MKTVVIAFLFTFIFSSPIHASIGSKSDYAVEPIQERIAAVNLSKDTDSADQSRIDKPIIVILGDDGEVYFIFMNQFFSLHINDEASLPFSAPSGKSYY